MKRFVEFLKSERLKDCFLVAFLIFIVYVFLTGLLDVATELWHVFF